ncbi:alpha/beta hydrolase [Pollutibacter soli]|uniref:alpha/beta hydrolase n=1 Tax=Pollutibacter soli TaxID=3034157 RepID=UPI0030132900
MNRKRIKRIIQWVVIIYCLLGTALYYLQEKMIFHPTPIAFTDTFKIDRPFKEVNIPYDPHTNLSIIKFEVPREKKKGAVLYFHGNMKNVEYYAPLTEEFQNRGYDVWMLDYPGYGKSTGKISEKLMYEFSEQMYKMANSEINADSIVLYGKSLGTGLASYIAAKKTAAYLILETPYYSMHSVAFSRFPIYPVAMMMHFEFPTYSYLYECKTPVFIFHGTDDRTISLSSAQKLKKYLKPGDEFLVVEGGKHNGLQKNLLVQKKLDSILGKVF